MKFLSQSLLITLVGLACSINAQTSETSSATSPSPSAVSDDNQWTCSATQACPAGYCCSTYGWCGKTAEHCVDACQSNCGAVNVDSSLGQATNGTVPLGRLIDNCVVPGTAAITFDDGPISITKDLLATLAEKEVKVTFFVIGEQLSEPENAETLKNAFDAGHHIASHTWNHPDLSKLSDDDVALQMKNTSDAIFNVIGKRPQYMRPPYGAVSDQTLSVLGSLGYKVIYWNLDTLDWETKDGQQTLEAYRTYLSTASVESSSILSLQHDIQASTIGVAGDIIDIVQEAGYKVVTVPECLGDDGLYY